MARTAAKIPNVTLIARHRPGCKYSGQPRRITCDCPKMMTWYRNGVQERKGAGTDATEAQRLADEKQQSFERADKGIVDAATPSGAALLSDIIAAFIDGKRGNGKVRTEKHLDKLRFELGAFETWCSKRNLMQVADVTLSHLIAYRVELQKKAPHQNTLAKKCFRIVGFFEYCVRLGILTRNVARSDDFIVDYAKQREPKALSDEQFAAVLKGVSQINGRTTDAERRKMYGLIVLMRHTGLAIRDALKRRREDFIEASDGSWRASISRSKTEGTATLVLTDSTMAEVFKHSNPEGFLFVDAWPGTEHACNALVEHWGNLLSKVGDKAALKDAKGHEVKFTSHVCRHTFARSLFDKGISTEDVARLLGDSPAVVGRYYSTWIKAREERLASRVLAAIAN